MIEPSSGSNSYQTTKPKRKWYQFWKGRKVSRKETTKVSTGHTIVRSRRLTSGEWQATANAVQRAIKEEKMPFKSETQRKYLFAKKPKVAKKIASDTKKAGKTPKKGRKKK